MRLCGAAFGCMYTYDGARFPIAAMRGVPEGLAHFIMAQPPLLPSPGGMVERVVATKRAVQILDLAADTMYSSGVVNVRAYVDLGGARTIVDCPLLREGSVIGLIAIYRKEVRAFSEKEVALLESFAAQAAIAMESARLLNALRDRTDELSQRQAELQVTFENMGDGVAMFDETQHLVAWNHKFQAILDVPDEVIARRQTFSEYVHYLASRGDALGPMGASLKSGTTLWQAVVSS
jgi:PAS domain-containing protein